MDRINRRTAGAFRNSNVLLKVIGSLGTKHSTKTIKNNFGCSCWWGQRGLGLFKLYTHNDASYFCY